MATSTPDLPVFRDGPPRVGSEVSGDVGDVGETGDVGDAGDDVRGRFQALYADHVDMVWRSLRSLGVPRENVEDAAQDVFLTVHRRLPEFEARSSVRTWLFGIVLHVARNHRRRERRKGGCAPLDMEVVDHAPGPHEEAMTAEALELLAQVLGDLDEAKREVFVLGELEQMTAPEIAGALGVNVNTVYSRLRLSRSAFDAALARRRRGRR